jgi:RimJ/RimL family protein N-acetyltransferase
MLKSWPHNVRFSCLDVVAKQANHIIIDDNRSMIIEKTSEKCAKSAATVCYVAPAFESKGGKMRVTIRRHEDSDQAILNELFKHPEVSAQLWMPWNADSWISESRKSLMSAYRFRILVDGKVAGIAAIESPTLPRDEYQINFVLGRYYWDRGIADEVLRQTVRFGFGVLHLSGMFTWTESDNRATAQVLEKVGFQQTMVWKEHVHKDGTYLDKALWTLFSGARLETSGNGIGREVRLQSFPNPEHFSPIDLFDDYPFGSSVKTEKDAPFEASNYLATARYFRFWGNEIYMPESRKRLDRNYGFTILADNEIVGDMDLGDPTECKTTYEVGYAIGRPFWNKGICTEALRKLVRFAFDELNIRKIRCDTDAGNPASVRVLRKIGFTEEEKFDTALRKDSWFAHTVYVSLFNPAYEHAVQTQTN